MPALEDYAAASARVLFDALNPRNPTQLAVIVADLGLVNDTPQVLVGCGGTTRQATWLIPNAIVVGKAVFVARLDARVAASLAVIAPGYQIPWVASGGGASTGSTLGVGAGSATPSDDWAADMTDPANEDGATLPLILGQVSL